MNARTPNVLFILTDQQRADSLGTVNGWSSTPNLDALRRESTMFSTCITTAPVCIPARFSLATGFYPHNLGTQKNGAFTLPPTIPTWMQRFRDAGYRTSMFGKTHYHGQWGDLRDRSYLLSQYGFDDFDEIAGPRALGKCTSRLTDEWQRAGVLDAYRRDVAQRLEHEPCAVRPTPVGLPLYYDTYVGQRATRYLRDYNRTEPWLCCVWFAGPHEPWDTPMPWAEMHDPADAPAPAPIPSSNYARPTGYLDDRLARSPNLSAEQVAALRADYAGNVALIDDQIGAIFGAIRARNEWDDTIVVFTSDHGEMNGDAGLVYKNVFLDGSCRVPLLIRDPAGSATAREVGSPVEMFDIAPTMLDLAGIDADDFGFAHSLGALVRGGRAPVRASALSEYDGEVLLVNDEWKVACNRAGEIYLLFDRVNDPGETENLAGSPERRDVENDLRRALLERLVQASSRTPPVPMREPGQPARGGLLRAVKRLGWSRH